MNNYEKCAFPVVRELANKDGQILTPGMSKREYFAANALQGVISGITSAVAIMAANPKSAPLAMKYIETADIGDKMAQDAVKYADDLLAELDRTDPKK
ncbi:MAG: hypothetical protein LUD76_10045 [Alistipes sp.]|nr:hypothetical protein [Alistipes sp.]